MNRLQALVVGVVFSMAGVCSAAGPPLDNQSSATGKSEGVTGTIEGEVKKIQPDSVIVEKEPEGRDVRLQLHGSTHQGPIKEGDKVEAFVTPGGTTTSVQPRTEGLNR